MGPRPLISLPILAVLLAGCVSQAPDPDERTVALAPDTTPQPAAPASTTTDAAPAASRATIVTDTPAPTGTAADAAAPGNAETMTVVGHSFTGLWKVNSPKRLGSDSGLFSGFNIHYSGESGDRDICELQQTGDRLDAHCLRLGRDVAGSVDGDDVTLRSWIGPANLILKARAQSTSALVGTIGGGALGLRVTAGVPVRAVKLRVPAPGTEGPDAGMVHAVLADVAAGHLTAGRYGGEATAHLGRDLDGLRGDLAGLGPLGTMTYIDRLLPRHPYDPAERPLEVYRLDYAGGMRLCGISLTTAGIVEDFLCR